MNVAEEKILFLFTGFLFLCFMWVVLNIDELDNQPCCRHLHVLSLDPNIYLQAGLQLLLKAFISMCFCYKTVHCSSFLSVFAFEFFGIQFFFRVASFALVGLFSNGFTTGPCISFFAVPYNLSLLYFTFLFFSPILFVCFWFLSFPLDT